MNPAILTNQTGVPSIVRIPVSGTTSIQASESTTYYGATKMP